MSTAGAPTVSVIIPAYNSERYIRAALDSVLAQTDVDYEVIVVDDGSSDGTDATVRQVGGPVHYIRQSNQGPAAARNTGITASKGELICFLDADDVWLSGKLQTQVAFMREHPEVGLLFADAEEFDDSGVHCPSLLAKSRFHGEIGKGATLARAFAKLLEENFIPTSTVMVRRACFDTAGLFDVTLKGPEDRDMWSRIAAHYPIASIPTMLGRKREVASSVSRDVESTLRSRVRLWTKARRLFPDLAPESTVNALLAQTFVQLGFLLLRKDQMHEARRAAWSGLRLSRDPGEWLLALSLLVFSFTGNGFAGFVFRTKARFVSSRVRG
jgi:glycosyltransferase involved in cell wall biosynthesis